MSRLIRVLSRYKRVCRLSCIDTCNHASIHMSFESIHIILHRYINTLNHWNSVLLACLSLYIYTKAHVSIHICLASIHTILHQYKNTLKHWSSVMFAYLSFCIDTKALVSAHINLASTHTCYVLTHTEVSFLEIILTNSMHQYKNACIDL